MAATIATTSDFALQDLAINELTSDAFAPFGTVVPPMEDGVEFGPHDAQLDLTQGTPRFYCMRIPGRGLLVKQITRHRSVTQTLASSGGHDWWLAVAPPKNLDVPDAEPAIEDIRAFRIPGDTAVMLYKGTWHAGPLFDGGERSFFNLELADTNVVDHHTCKLTARYGLALKLV
ncbi:ureidoglycolate lyase [Methyloraptor flagellatus]|jgi:ureidoglycolate hydrolase|uniref:Ureidoglycolate lyase n=1 Tax=Methyloraptor flagellatus TaxID=3162530 RepID=A0AAU7X8X9_9HYPH